jgi:hypothetical protein
MHAPVSLPARPHAGSTRRLATPAGPINSIAHAFGADAQEAISPADDLAKGTRTFNAATSKEDYQCVGRVRRACHDAHGKAVVPMRVVTRRNRRCRVTLR